MDPIILDSLDSGCMGGVAFSFSIRTSSSLLAVPLAVKNCADTTLHTSIYLKEKENIAMTDFKVGSFSPWCDPV